MPSNARMTDGVGAAGDDADLHVLEADSTMRTPPSEKRSKHGLWNPRVHIHESASRKER